MQKLKNVRLVSLDVTNTLIRIAEEPALTYKRFGRQFRIAIDENEVRQRFPKVFKELERRKPAYGFHQNGAQAWWSELLELCCVNHASFPNFEDFQCCLWEYYSRRDAWKVLDPNVEDHLSSLKSKGLRLAVLSNFDSRLRQILAQLKIDSFFDFIILSGEVGAQKPDPVIFEALLSCSGLEKHQVLHIGDHFEKDFLGAKKFGFQSLLFDRSKCKDVSSHDKIENLGMLLQTD